MKRYNFLKAKQIIAENADKLESVCLGMHEDWFWTAGTIWEDGEYAKDFPKDEDSLKTHTIGGINGSAWATPTIELRFKDGSEEMCNCYIGESDGKKPDWFSLGELSQLTQNKITPISENN
jgi:hypothetical protein